MKRISITTITTTTIITTGSDAGWTRTGKTEKSPHL